MFLQRQTQAAIELFTSSILWGFGFIATVWALKIFSPAEVLFLRFILAFVVGEILTMFFNKESVSRFDIQNGLIAGLLLGTLLLFQTWGLLYTTPTQSGFITSLYVILTPLFLHLFWKQKILSKTYFNAFLALLGLLILISPASHNLSSFTFNKGDLLTFACAVFAAFQIIFIEFKSQKIINGFQFNNYQSLGAAFLCLPNLYLQYQHKGSIFNPEAFEFSKHPQAWLGIISLALGSSLLAFYIQVRAQRILKATTASLFFLLEAPFALLFSVYLLDEKLTSYQIVGVFILLFASFKQLHSERNELSL